jgi:ribonuclease HI
VVIYTDGAARGNPGPSASGFMAYEGKKLLKRHAEYNGNATNNLAEYNAVLLALKWCLSNLDAKDSSLKLYSDNELVVRQINGRYKIKSKKLKPFNEEIKGIAVKFKSVSFGNVRRENLYISAVDRALNRLLDARLKPDDTK